jgi:hypothetical protein
MEKGQATTKEVAEHLGRTRTEVACPLNVLYSRGVIRKIREAIMIPPRCESTALWSFVKGNREEARLASTSGPLRIMQRGRVGGRAAYQAIQYEDEVRKLRIALKESVRLQSHYAGLLNQSDGGQRMIFETPEKWIARLIETKTIRIESQVTNETNPAK